MKETRLRYHHLVMDFYARSKDNDKNLKMKYNTVINKRQEISWIVSHRTILLQQLRLIHF